MAIDTAHYEFSKSYVYHPKHDPDYCDGHAQMPVCSDASHAQWTGERFQGLGGFAVVYRPPGRTRGGFLARARRVDWLPEILHGEMFGIAVALFIGLEEAEDEERKDKAREGGGGIINGSISSSGVGDPTKLRRGGRVLIFADPQRCLRLLRMQDVAARNALLDDVSLPIVEAACWASNELLDRHGVRVEIHWMPGHEHDVYPHWLADQLSRDVWKGGIAGGDNQEPSTRLALALGMWADDQVDWRASRGYQLERQVRFAKGKDLSGDAIKLDDNLEEGEVTDEE